MFAQPAQFRHRIAGRFDRLPGGFFSGDARVRQRPRHGGLLAILDRTQLETDGGVAALQFGGEEVRGRFSPARDLIGGGGLGFEPLLGGVERTAAFARLRLDPRHTPAQRVAGGAEMRERIGDALGVFAGCGLGVFDARGQAEHRTVDHRHRAVEAAERELRAPLDRVHALGDPRRIANARRLRRFGDAPIVIVRGMGELRPARLRGPRRLRRGGRGRGMPARLLILQSQIQIFAEAHALTGRGFAGRLAHLWIDILQVPALHAAHLALAAYKPAQTARAHVNPQAILRITRNLAVSIRSACMLMSGKKVNGNKP